MKPDEILDCDDLGEALREGRPLRLARTYRILFAKDDLDFHPLRVTDPVPLGRQILDSAGLDPKDGYSLFAILRSGDFEDVRLNEPFDLRAHGSERFVAFLTDRIYKLTLNEAQVEWGKPAISGTALYALAEPGADEAVFLEVRGGQDRLIEPGELIDLTKPGIERFITAPKTPDSFEIIVNSRVRTVDAKQVTFEQVVELAFPGKHASNVVFSMTYRHAASRPHAGELASGGVVEVKPTGTVFNVTRTVQS
ncbi:MAG: multiubiquitin domain-containing protein [Gammaproteobacteria bacterium]|nr:multiubiquitin domain-containing protein [Gammaproteobacteria bacterium]